MKHLNPFNLNEGKLNEANASEKELQESLNKVATDFWKKRGAKFGKEQTIKDFVSLKSESYGGSSFPARFDNDTKFITEEAKIEVGGGDGRSIICALWVTPYKKDGSKGQKIRLTWGYTPSKWDS